MQRGQGVEHVTAVIGRATPASLHLGRGGKNLDIERRPAREGDAMHARGYLIAPQVLGHRQSLRGGRLLVSPTTPQSRVLAAQRHELVVGAQLGDLAVHDHTHAIGVVRGVQAMRDGDDGATS